MGEDRGRMLFGSRGRGVMDGRLRVGIVGELDQDEDCGGDRLEGNGRGGSTKPDSGSVDGGVMLMRGGLLALPILPTPMDSIVPHQVRLFRCR